MRERRKKKEKCQLGSLDSREGGRRVDAKRGGRTNLESSSLFELSHITLTLERRVGSEEDVFDVVVDVLLPGSEPGDGVLVDDLSEKEERRASVSLQSPVELTRSKEERTLTSFHFPGMLGTGTGASAPMLMVMSSGESRSCERERRERTRVSSARSLSKDRRVSRLDEERKARSEDSP